jgi:hypothetical protein
LRARQYVRHWGRADLVTLDFSPGSPRSGEKAVKVASHFLSRDFSREQPKLPGWRMLEEPRTAASHFGSRAATVAGLPHSRPQRLRRRSAEEFGEECDGGITEWRVSLWLVYHSKLRLLRQVTRVPMML